MRVAAGAIARKYLRERLGVDIQGYLAQIGPLQLEPKSLAGVYDNPFFCPDPARVEELDAYMTELRRSGDSVGARVNVIATGVPPGLGEPVFDKLDADIAHAMMGINAVKGVEIGAGFAAVEQKGSQHRDEMSPRGLPVEQRGRRARRHFLRAGHRGEHRAQADFEHHDPRPDDRRAGRRASRSSPPAVTIRASACGPRRSRRRCSRSC